jgi:hypothetical protein
MRATVTTGNFHGGFAMRQIKAQMGDAARPVAAKTSLLSRVQRGILASSRQLAVSLRIRDSSIFRVRTRCVNSFV